MHPKHVLTTVAALFVLQTSCKERQSEQDAAPAEIVDAASEVGADSRPEDLKPLGIGCASDGECASDFCVDGVCCASRCDQQCARCDVGSSRGHCTPQLFGDDLAAAIPCTGAKTCSLDRTSPSIVSCRLKDMQACTSDSECATGKCATFYVDTDGDGYGATGTLHLCSAAGGAAPPGYSAMTGDCCDSDPFANPGQTSWFDTADACDSWDYNCDGIVEAQYTPSGSPPPDSYCGKALLSGKDGCH
jgi:hypothetical protein